ncbi:MAG: heme exporter protein CcmB [Gammaproteobacteria bacterium]|nr:MAG: heme exporter protein CcmB [Gammaproteobacteria bacterium]
MKRDLVLAFRQRGDMINPLFFFLMVVSLFPLGVGPEPGQLQKMAPGIIWIAALLSTLLAVDSLFRQDFDDGALELLLLSPHPLFSLVGAKVLAHWLVTAIPLILASPFLGLMLFLEGEQLLVVMLTLILGTPVLSMISAIGAALTVGLRKGGVLIAIIALPLYVPVLIFGTSAIEAASIGMPFIGQVAYLGALLALAITFAPFAIAAGLRVSVSG